MGRYFNPVSDLPKVGKRLKTASIYQSLIGQLRPGEQLVGLYDKGVYKAAPFLFDEREFAEFEI